MLNTRHINRMVQNLSKNPPAEIVDDIFWVTLINAIAQIPLWSISFILPTGLRAAGDSRFTSIASMLSMWLFRLALGYMLGIVLGFGVLGVWLAMNCEWGVRGAIFLWRFRGKKWYRISWFNLWCFGNHWILPSPPP